METNTVSEPWLNISWVKPTSRCSTKWWLQGSNISFQITNHKIPTSIFFMRMSKTYFQIDLLSQKKNPERDEKSKKARSTRSSKWDQMSPRLIDWSRGGSRAVVIMRNTLQDQFPVFEEAPCLPLPQGSLTTSTPLPPPPLMTQWLPFFNHSSEAFEKWRVVLIKLWHSFYLKH